MINITRKDNIITFTGHTIPDICAAVSSVMYTTVNILDKYDKYCLSFKDDTVNDRVNITILKHDAIIDMVVNNMFDMFNDLIEDGNEDKIRIN